MIRVSKTALFAAAKRWDASRVSQIFATSPALLAATDPGGRAALHLACAVKPGGSGLCEANGIATATALLDAGSDLEAVVPMDEDEGDFRATPIWYAVARGGNLPLVRFLLNRGADAGLYWNQGLASICGHMAKHRFFMRRGCCASTLSTC
jgi:uncharacterized protein